MADDTTIPITFNLDQALVQLNTLMAQINQIARAARGLSAGGGGGGGAFVGGGMLSRAGGSGFGFGGGFFQGVSPPIAAAAALTAAVTRPLAQATSGTLGLALKPFGESLHYEVFEKLKFMKESEIFLKAQDRANQATIEAFPFGGNSAVISGYRDSMLQLYQKLERGKFDTSRQVFSGSVGEIIGAKNSPENEAAANQLSGIGGQIQNLIDALKANTTSHKGSPAATPANANAGQK